MSVLTTSMIIDLAEDELRRGIGLALNRLTAVPIDSGLPQEALIGLRNEARRAALATLDRTTNNVIAMLLDHTGIKMAAERARQTAAAMKATT